MHFGLGEGSTLLRVCEGSGVGGGLNRLIPRLVGRLSLAPLGPVTEILLVPHRVRYEEAILVHILLGGLRKGQAMGRVRVLEESIYLGE